MHNEPLKITYAKEQVTDKPALWITPPPHYFNYTEKKSIPCIMT